MNRREILGGLSGIAAFGRSKSVASAELVSEKSAAIWAVPMALAGQSAGQFVRNGLVKKMIQAAREVA